MYKYLVFDSMIMIETKGSRSTKGLVSWTVGFHLDAQQAQLYQLDMESLTVFNEQQLERRLQTTDACPDTCPSDGASECKYVRWFRRLRNPTAARLYNPLASARKLQQLLTVLLGCHHLPVALIANRSMPRGQSFEAVLAMPNND